MKILKRVISQRVLGHQKNSLGRVTHAVLEYENEWQNGSVSTVYQAIPLPGSNRPQLDGFLDSCPRIDIHQ